MPTCTCTVDVQVTPPPGTEVNVTDVGTLVEVQGVPETTVEVIAPEKTVVVHTVETQVVELPFVPSSTGALPRMHQVLVGDIDGVNTVFTTPAAFVHLGFLQERVFYNGVMQEEGASNDYVASESGGVGTGYDTITFAFAPLPGDKLWADYYLA